MLEHIPPKHTYSQMRHDSAMLAILTHTISSYNLKYKSQEMTPEIQEAFWHAIDARFPLYHQWLQWHGDKKAVERRVWAKFIKGDRQ